MTVYELIQELSRYQADTEVRFHFTADFDADVEAKFDRANKDDLQEVTSSVTFDDHVDYDRMALGIRYPYDVVFINLTY